MEWHDKFKSLLLELSTQIDTASHNECRSGKAAVTRRNRAKSLALRIAKLVKVPMTNEEAAKIATPWI